jgi:hypothetical protein
VANFSFSAIVGNSVIFFGYLVVVVKCVFLSTFPIQVQKTAIYIEEDQDDQAAAATPAADIDNELLEDNECDDQEDQDDRGGLLVDLTARKRLTALPVSDWVLRNGKRVPEEDDDSDAEEELEEIREEVAAAEKDNTYR